MRKFLQTILQFSIIPICVFIICIVGFFVFDPYKMFHKYDTYSQSLVNRDLSGIRTLTNKYQQYKYDSFLFGSSRTLGFRPSSWAKHLKKDSSPLALDAFLEIFYGIYHKIKYLDSHGFEINNAIIIIDPDLTFVTEYPNRESPSFYKYPDIDGSSWFQFYRDYLFAYLDPNVMSTFYLNRFFDLKNKYIYQHIGDIKADINSVTNGLELNHLEDEIKSDSISYYKKVFFADRGDTLVVSDTYITKKQLGWLKEVKSIFDKHHTNYKIIISPLYTHKVMSTSDKNALINVFGADRVYDFSGINTLTNPKHNYYEMYHYRPLVGDSIMNYIYKYPGTKKFE